MLAPSRLLRTTARWRHSISSATVERDALRLEWSDARVSLFHHAWLRDHCPQSLHPSSGQRSLALADAVRATPLRAELGGADGGAQTLDILWEDDAHRSSFNTGWLRKHCYSEAARRERRACVAARDGGITTWSGEIVANRPQVEWSAMQGAGAAGEAGLLGCLERLHRFGFCLVRGVPKNMEATRELAEQLGVVHETFFGRMWDTGGAVDNGFETGEETMIDTAYSKDALPLHTDGSYLQQQPGLQLFNCVEQTEQSDDASAPLAGSTKLADGFQIARIMREQHPESYDFLCRTPLPFKHCADDVEMAALSPVFWLHPVTGEVAEFRYNATDRAPLDMLSHADVGAFYEHVGKLEAVIESQEVCFRLKEGEAVVLNNQRVLHGRHAFVGGRNLLGCYLTADDWKSRLRVLRRKLAAA